MLRHTLRSLLAYRARLLLTAVAIMVGVGAVAGTFVLGDSAKAAAEAAFAEAAPRVDVVVRSAPQGEGEVFSDITGELFADAMPAAVLDRVARLDGVAAATGVVVGDAHLIGRGGHVIGVRAPLGRSIDTSFAGALRAGRVPAGPGEVVIDSTTARDESFGPGDRVRVIPSGGEPRTATVVGVLDSPEIPDGVVLVGFDPATAGRLLAPTGQINYVELRAVAGLGQQALRDRVAAAIGPGYQVFTEAELGAERARNATPQEGGTGQILFVAAVLALFAGSFIIRNTFSIVLASQTRELALLRCAGASRGQLRRSILLQAVIVGALAGVAGVVFGVGLAWGLGALLRAVEEAVADVRGNLVVLPRTVAVALAVGVGTAVVSAWGPARRASRVAPVAALRADVFALDRRTSRARTVAGTLATLAGVGAVLVAVLGDPIRTTYLWAGAGAVAAGVLVLGPVLARALSGLLGLPVSRATGVVGELARGNAVRSPRRTSATVLPLVIGLALISFVTTLAAGTKASTVGGFERTFLADWRLATVGTGMHQPLMSQQVAQRLRGLPELAGLVAFQDTGVMVGDAASVNAGATAADPVQLGQALSLEVTDGALADLGTGAVAVDRRVAVADGLAIGSRVRLRVPDGGQASFTVRAVYDTSGLDDFVGQELPITDYLITPADHLRLAGDRTGLTMALATTRDGVTQGAARAAIERAIADYPNVEIASRDQLLRRATAQIDPVLRLFYSLLGLAVVVALFGVVNTLALSIMERVRELGLLRAIGMDRRQLGSMVRWEAVIIAAIGVTIGLGLGTFLGWAATVALEPSTPAIPVGQLAGFAAAAVLASVLAAAVPARRAARIDLLRAIATE